MTATALAQLRPHLAVTPGSSSIMRTARREDAAAIHALVVRYREAGRLLPRTEDEIARHAERFLVILDGEDVMGCAELAPLSAKVAEVRSLVLDESLRGLGLGRLLVEQLTREARTGGLHGDLRVHARGRHISPVSASRSCRTRGCPRRLPPIARAARCSASAGSTAMRLHLDDQAGADAHRGARIEDPGDPGRHHGRRGVPGRGRRGGHQGGRARST